MNCTSFFVLASTSAFMLAGGVRAESEAEYGNPRATSAPVRTLGGATALGAATEQDKPRPSPAARPAMFAPAAAANARRMTAEQRDERRFLKAAAANSRFEAEAARMALGKSNDPGVRSLAATLINYHASASNELLHMLHGRGMAAPMLANDQRKVLNRLAKLHGSKFDREFLREVALKNQHEDVQAYEQASFVAREPRLKGWIDRTLPTLRYHLATAERLAPADVKLARGVAGSPSSAAANQFVSRASVATQSMGAAPATGGMQFGGAAQLGASR
jgi:predicted outer membrane protein